MAQHDYNIANDTAANVRADINDVLAAIVSNNSGPSAPATTYANQWWYDSSNNILKIRNEADTGWIDFATINQTNSQIEFVTLYADNISDGTTSVGTEYVVNGSAKAWANFNGTGIIAIRNSLNVSSLTDNGTGLYTVSLTNDMADVNYVVMGGNNANNDADSVANAFTMIRARAAGSTLVQHLTAGGTAIDPSYVGVDWKGDLA